MKFVMIGVLLLIGLSANCLLAAAVWPERLAKSKRMLTVFPLRCWLCGVLALVIEVWLGLAVHGAPPMLVAMGLLNLVFLAQGFPAMAELAGERLGAGTRWRALIVGAVVISVAVVVPLVGWLLGAVVMTQALGAPVVRDPALPVGAVA